MKPMSDLSFHKMLYKAVTGSQKRRQAASLALRDLSFNRTIDQHYPAAALFSVIRAKKRRANHA